jgi:catechol 2,3-dioxygenase-like lactoylglutathione lyase family enzyme
MSRVIHFVLAAALVSGTFAVGEEKPSRNGAHRGSTPQQTARVPAIAAIRSVGMTVSDMDRAVIFYSGALAFKKVSDVEVTGREYEQLLGVFGLRIRVVGMQLGDELLTLTQYVAPSDGKPIPIDSRSNDIWFEHTAISVSDTEKSLRFYRDLLGMRSMGGSLNVGTEQEHLDNVFGARVRVTSVRPVSQPPHVEFLDYVVPSDGRPMPREIKAKDIVHWQTELVVDEIGLIMHLA